MQNIRSLTVRICTLIRPQGFRCTLSLNSTSLGTLDRARAAPKCEISLASGYIISKSRKHFSCQMLKKSWLSIMHQQSPGIRGSTAHLGMVEGTKTPAGEARTHRIEVTRRLHSLPPFSLTAFHPLQTPTDPLPHLPLVPADVPRGQVRTCSLCVGSYSGSCAHASGTKNTLL